MPRVSADQTAPPELRIHPLTPDRFADLERLFGPRGACAGCWCMWWRLPRAQWEAGKGEGNRRGLETYVRGGAIPGLLAYDGEAPVGWVAVEPRAAYPRLARSRSLAPVDERPVWSITCFFVARSHRGRGVTRALVEAAAAHARTHGAPALEAYPVDSRARLGDAFLYTGARLDVRGARVRGGGAPEPDAPARAAPAQRPPASARRTCSCTRPFDSTQLPDAIVARPSRSVKRPPASSTRIGSGPEIPELHARLDPRLRLALQHERGAGEIAVAARALRARGERRDALEQRRPEQDVRLAERERRVRPGGDRRTPGAAAARLRRSRATRPCRGRPSRSRRARAGPSRPRRSRRRARARRAAPRSRARG